MGKFALRAQSAWKHAVATFEEVSARHPYDLLIGDETYEIEAALEKRPELKKAPFVMIYDFVGLDAMSHNPLEPGMRQIGRQFPQRVLGGLRSWSTSSCVRERRQGWHNEMSAAPEDFRL